MSRRKQRPAAEPLRLRIESLSHEGRGIARVNGKTVFVFGALPGETVLARIDRRKRSFDEASTLQVIEASPLRVAPRCAAFGVCGGCSLQHLDGDAQVEVKQQALLERLAHAGIAHDELLPPLRGPAWGYRAMARLGVKHVPGKGRVLVGFRERGAPYIADMRRCEVLLPAVGERLELLSETIGRLDAKARIPQIEVAADGERVQLVIRHLDPLSAADSEILRELATRHGFWVQLQGGGPETVHDLCPEGQRLTLDPLGDGVNPIAFQARDFVQVNREINRQMVGQALAELDLEAGDRVLDLYCGLGNFTLPMARRAARVTGVEGDVAMVERARGAARGLGVDNTDYHAADLERPDEDAEWMRREYDKILIDPPRSGAREMASRLARFAARRVVYVSCQPSSLVRDAAIIVALGYRLSRVGIIDMFPQTAHVESMAVFEQTSGGRK